MLSEDAKREYARRRREYDTSRYWRIVEKADEREVCGRSLREQLHETAQIVEHTVGNTDRERHCIASWSKTIRWYLAAAEEARNEADAARPLDMPPIDWESRYERTGADPWLEYAYRVVPASASTNASA